MKKRIASLSILLICLLSLTVPASATSLYVAEDYIQVVNQINNEYQVSFKIIEIDEQEIKITPLELREKLELYIQQHDDSQVLRTNLPNLQMVASPRAEGPYYQEMSAYSSDAYKVTILTTYYYHPDRDLYLFSSCSDIAVSSRVPNAFYLSVESTDYQVVDMQRTINVQVTGNSYYMGSGLLMDLGKTTEHASFYYNWIAENDGKI